MKMDFTTLTELIIRFLPLQDWGFTESIRFHSGADFAVIYNSQWCRVKFYIERERFGENLHVYYGRLHALDNALIMKWNGENCYCWHDHHDLQLALNFLDRVSPQDAYKTRLAPIKLFQDYYDSDLAKNASSGPEEHSIKLHSLIWKHYGIRFFELFDLQHPDLWHQYIDYLKEFYRLEDKEFNLKGIKRVPYDPPQYKKC